MASGAWQRGLAEPRGGSVFGSLKNRTSFGDDPTSLCPHPLVSFLPHSCQNLLFVSPTIAILTGVR